MQLERLPARLKELVDADALEGVPVFAGLPEALASLKGLQQACTLERLKAIWEIPATYEALAVVDKGVTVELRNTGRKALAARKTQEVEPVGLKRAGRPPRQARLTVHQARKVLHYEMKRAGGLMKMEKSRREKFLYLMQLDDEGWSDSEEESVEFFEDDADEEAYESYLDEYGEV